MMSAAGSREFDINELYRDAQNRWLKPPELLFLLQNHERQHMATEAPQCPPSGSLFLFNRRVLRFFRKDGYVWRKKKDGRTVGEAHERLKVGNVDTLNCYYAHGEQNPNLQRRSYWMLDPAWDHIVLVHYRELTEGRPTAGSMMSFSGESSSLFSQSTVINNAQNLNELPQNSLSPGQSVEEVCSTLALENGSYNMVTMDEPRDFSSSNADVNQALSRLREQLSLENNDESINYLEGLPPYSTNEESHNVGMVSNEGDGSRQSGRQDDLDISLSPSTGNKRGMHDPESVVGSWKDVLAMFSSSQATGSQQHNFDNVNLQTIPNSSSRILQIDEVRCANRTAFLEKDKDPFLVPAEPPKQYTSEWPSASINSGTNGSGSLSTSKKSLSQQLSETRRFLLGSDDPIDSPNSTGLFQEFENSVPLAQSYSAISAGEALHNNDSSDWIVSRSAFTDKDKSFSPGLDLWFSHDSHLGNPLASDANLTVADVQRFSIRDVSPEWAYSMERTKVIITGNFLCHPSKTTWACMFGNVEVPVEIIQEGVFRCRTPCHPAGKVTLCITSANREACSEVREFEFCSQPQSSSLDFDSRQKEVTRTKEELTFLFELVDVLLCSFDGGTVQKEGSVELESEPLRKCNIADDGWKLAMHALLASNDMAFHTMDMIVEVLLKDKFRQWALSKRLERDMVTSCSLCRQEQCMIHMIAALGYEWALDPILSSGVGVNFRDVNGWTALHWAAKFGREKMVAALIAQGASPGAVTDPTPQNPSGCTPAAVAASEGHKGLAGYLSEAALTTHLSSLTLEENDIDKSIAVVEAEQMVENISDLGSQLPICENAGAQLALKESLAAVRNAAQAAARIQSAFRTHSFRKRQQRAVSQFDVDGMNPIDISAWSKLHRTIRNLPNQRANKAALSIQKNYRGWKKRKEYLKLRQNVVKIQAHVRGHQVRKKYKEFLWTVGILEKAVLRWRRKGAGLRGFRPELEIMEESEDDDDILKVFRKQKVDAALQEAMTRVFSMAESSEARQQYLRMLKSYQQAKAQLSSHSNERPSSGTQGSDDNLENEDFMRFFA